MGRSRLEWRKSTRSQETNCVEVATWHKSSRSQGSGQCVEVADDLGGVVGMRDSKDTSGPVLVFSPDQWTAFIDGVKAGEFDLR